MAQKENPQFIAKLEGLFKSMTNAGSIESRYILKEKIGQGSYGSVFKGIHKLTNIEVSIKMIEKGMFQNDQAKIHFMNEAVMMKDLNHPLIAQVYEIIESQNTICIISELAKNGDLLHYVNSKNDSLSESEAKHFFLQLIYALQYLHDEMKIAHRDIKPENILLDEDNNIRLIDFGFAKAFDDNVLFSSLCGSPAYVAPEVVTGQKYNQMGDIWSVGITLFAIITGTLPFNGNNMQEQLRKIAYCDPYYPSKMSNEIVDLLRKMLQKDFNKRISLNDILQHTWMKSYVENNKMMEVFNRESANFDSEIAMQMQILGLNTSNLENDLIMKKMNELTITYKLLQRSRIRRLLKSSTQKRINIVPKTPNSLFGPRRIASKISLNAFGKRNENDFCTANNQADQIVAKPRNIFLNAQAKTARKRIQTHDIFRQNLNIFSSPTSSPKSIKAPKIECKSPETVHF